MLAGCLCYSTKTISWLVLSRAGSYVSPSNGGGGFICCAEFLIKKNLSTWGTLLCDRSCTQEYELVALKCDSCWREAEALW